MDDLLFHNYTTGIGYGDIYMENEKYVYQRNIRIIQKFYNSDYCRELKEKNLIRAIINAIYIDPDNSDEHMYKDLSEKLKLIHKDGKCELYDNMGIKLSADAVCGWKQLYDLKEGNKEWLKDYEEMRRCTAAYLVWPQHKNPTINTLRYSVFKDRVDYTLFDISKFFDCKKKFDENKNQKQFEDNVKKTCKLHKAYLNSKGKTYDWLMTFDGFKDFINTMCLKRFVNSSTYNVLDLGADNTEKYITDYSESYRFNDKYLKHIKRIIKHSNDSKE